MAEPSREPADTPPIEPGKQHALEAWLAEAIGASAVSIAGVVRLSGGAIQDNLRLDVEVSGGPRAGRHAWVLRTDAPARLSVSLDRASEYEVIRAAWNAGVKVAEPIARCASAGPLSAPFLVQTCLTGTAQARRIARDPALPGYGAALAGELAAELARIHAIRPGAAAPSCLPLPALPPARHEVARLRHALAGAGEARPALEYCLAWLDAHAPPARPLTLVHGDFRTGNYLVEAGRLIGVLDWEFAHWGDPNEDLGWITARCWRFGNETLVAGGIAQLGALLEPYAAAVRHTIEPRMLLYWQIMAAAKWATIAVLQGDRYRRDGEERLELALTGLMAPEMEYDALSEILAWNQRGDPAWQ